MRVIAGLLFPFIVTTIITMRFFSLSLFCVSWLLFPNSFAQEKAKPREYPLGAESKPRENIPHGKVTKLSVRASLLAINAVGISL